MSENLMIAIFLEAWLQSSPWPNRRDSRHRILAQFEFINQVADALRRAAEGHAPPAIRDRTPGQAIPMAGS